MIRYTFGDLLPLSGAAAPLLTAAVGFPYPTTLTELAASAGISKFAASRASQSLLEAKLLLRGPDGFEFNKDHPLAGTIVDLAWRFSGVTPDDIEDPRELIRGEDFHYRRTVPESLQKDAPVPQELLAPTGPTLVTARTTCDWLDRQAGLLPGFEDDGQNVYSLWSNERLRDIIHQTLHMGGAVSAAWNTLAVASTDTIQGDADPFDARVSAYSWVRATYLVSAEARDLLRVIGLLDQAVWVGSSVNRLRKNAVYGLNVMNYVGRESELFNRHLEEALADERESAELWSDPSFGPWHNFGGTPHPEDVGTAGDQIVAVRLLRAAKVLASQVAIMAAEPCVQLWIHDNPEEAHALPLVTEIPKTALRGRREWPGPAKPRRGSQGSPSSFPND